MVHRKREEESDDEAPEEISLSTSKAASVSQRQNERNRVKEVRAEAKLKRKNIHNKMEERSAKTKRVEKSKDNLPKEGSGKNVAENESTDFLPTDVLVAINEVREKEKMALKKELREKTSKLSVKKKKIKEEKRKAPSVVNVKSLRALERPVLISDFRQKLLQENVPRSIDMLEKTIFKPSKKFARQS
uniref:Uncharacterized protein n=1 Tax=Polytomella parva TaxID=51329 RepID=A0A7S0Y865_9CHLO|mmetsp:Transcript_1310/g.1942  ORF Transcript_1310/g.1942 Transcript_1310/m.1942 type:complete len:188 (+) Transcript_1310:63-626(+)|eukprot:CAMPEP_0175057396 /NCGR_PEP_ID=MMETSP0052_2-20121109/11240_1 /TAXON_ID=51329 ORGANISM="Polytomella parva, Strain SAG 63-3" /NCGR_SAMPLE_ID=MMETSP0052_2 /ASSEMBLY_ACC=CAM_ASM_000194 /LENGTH=187 /DNA_ID=CAMNT_0016322603 /DNA_START=8 /DNA_END=571 /DNA_ORIENTATION=+